MQPHTDLGRGHRWAKTAVCLTDGSLYLPPQQLNTPV